MFQNFYICFCDKRWQQSGGFNEEANCPDCGCHAEPYISRDQARYLSNNHSYGAGDILSGQIIEAIIDGIPVCIIDRPIPDDEEQAQPWVFAYLLGYWRNVGGPRKERPDLSTMTEAINAIAAGYQGPSIKELPNA
jgi:hypothetical protein